MIIYHQSNVAAFAGAHTYWFLPQQILAGRIADLSTTVEGGDWFRLRAKRLP